MQDVIHGYLSDNVKIDKVADAAGANTTDVTGDELDMAGYDGVMFHTSFGTAAANNLLTMHHCDESGGSFAATTAASTPAASDEDQVLDVQHPTKRYVKVVASRGTSTTCGDIWAIRYKARSKPITNEVAGTQSVDKANAPASA